jgi:hypothetical protein
MRYDVGSASEMRGIYLGESGIAGAPEEAGGAESVQRPEGGIAGGRWEAPAWGFVILVAVVVVGSLVWGAWIWRRGRRMGR